MGTAIETLLERGLDMDSLSWTDMRVDVDNNRDWMWIALDRTVLYRIEVPQSARRAGKDMLSCIKADKTDNAGSGKSFNTQLRPSVRRKDKSRDAAP